MAFSLYVIKINNSKRTRQFSDTVILAKKQLLDASHYKISNAFLKK